MRKFHKLAAALCAAILLSLCFFSTAVYAAPEDETPTESTAAPAETNPPEGDNITLPPGVGAVVDVFTGEDGRKFYTIQTPAGNTFYLIIDFNRQSENVYFLDAVQEKDLLALAEKADSAEPVVTAPAPGANASNTAEPSPAEPEPEQGGGNMFSMILLVAIVVIGGGAGIYFKVIRKKRNADSRNEYEADEDEYIPDEPDGGEYGAEPEDGSPPWEENEDV